MLMKARLRDPEHPPDFQKSLFVFFQVTQQLIKHSAAPRLLEVLFITETNLASTSVTFTTYLINRRRRSQVPPPHTPLVCLFNEDEMFLDTASLRDS